MREASRWRPTSKEVFSREAMINYPSISIAGERDRGLCPDCFRSVCCIDLANKIVTDLILRIAVRD